jgi:hypothetical protein
MTRYTQQRLARQSAAYLSFAAAAVTGAAVAEVLQWLRGPTPDDHRLPAIWATAIAVLFLAGAGVSEYLARKLAGRGYVVTIGTDFGSTRHSAAVKQVASDCSDYADVQVRTDGISVERQMQLAQDIASSVVDTNFAARLTNVRRQVIINAQLHNAFAAGFALANFKDAEHLRLRVLHEARHTRRKAYFDALRIPLPLVEPDAGFTFSRTELTPTGPWLGFAANLTPNVNFSQDVHAHAATETRLRELRLVERMLTEDDERDLCYESILRALQTMLQKAVRETGCREVLLYFSGPAALAAGLGGLSTVGTKTWFAVYHEGGYVPSCVPRPSF